MSVMGYVGDQLGDHRTHELKLVFYDERRNVTVECEDCFEVVAELFNADMEADNGNRDVKSRDS